VHAARLDKVLITPRRRKPWQVKEEEGTKYNNNNHAMKQTKLNWFMHQKMEKKKWQKREK
jgi:hypothetical protein